MKIFGKLSLDHKHYYLRFVSDTMEVKQDLPKFEKRPFDLVKWRLRIESLVRQPPTLRYEDIRGLPNVSLTQDFRCLEGWIVRGVAWQGVRVSSVFELAELESEATSIMFSSGDYSTALPISKALEDSTILVLGMRGKVLDSYHGGPVRLVFHGQECYDSVKFVDSVRVLANQVEGTAKGIALSRLANRS